MTDERLVRSIAVALDELAAARTPDYLEAAIERASSTSQRPAWTFPERWLPMDIATTRVPTARFPVRSLAAVALISLLLASILAVYVGSQQPRLPAPFGPAANGSITFAQSGDIYVGDPETGQTQLLVGGPGTDVYPEVSRDGSKILFGREGAADVDLYVVRVDGSDLRRVTDAPLAGAQTGGWSADGTEYYQTHVVDGVQVLDAFDVTGDAPPRRLATNVADTIAVRPPDGGEIAFRTLVDGNLGIAVVRVDGTGLRYLVEPTVPAMMDQSFLNFSYTPDGRRLFYQHGDDDGNQYSPDDACCRLWVVDADGTDHREFVDLGRSWDGVPTVSPDGTSVAFWHQLNSAPSQRLTVARADGTGTPTEIGPRLETTGQWLWAPDSSKILLYPFDVSSARAFLVDPSGGDWTTVPWESAPGFDWQRTASP